MRITNRQRILKPGYAVFINSGLLIFNSLEMKTNYLLILATFLFFSCSDKNGKISQTSPDGNIKVEFFTVKDGIPAYKVLYKEKPVIETSKLGFDFKGNQSFYDNTTITGSGKASFSSEWEMPWGEKRIVDNTFNELKIQLKNKKTGLLCNVSFHIYNYGLGFRYEIPENENIKELIILDEKTQFKLTGNHTCWWIPGDWDIYEHLYNTTPFSKIDATSKRGHPALAQTYIPENAVNTPITMKTNDGLYLSFHEADLTDYASMTLRIDTTNLLMTSALVGSDITGYKVKRKLPFETPWRTIQISETAGGLIESDLIVNLNDPNVLGDVSGWVKPMKYAGIWWDMHLDTKTWNKTSGRHGATTEYAKELIDFASENNLGGLLVEGWNTGWEHWIGFEDREGVFDFVTCYPDYNLEEVVKYGKEKGVELIMHHETSAAPRTYEQQLDTAYSLMKSLGIHSVKTGYVGKIIPKGEYHQGQWMINHFQKVVETAAKYNIAVDAHETIKDTGLRRTYPNFMSRETFRGQEFNAWSPDGGNPPEHLTILAFTTMLAGPMDYTPGIFNISLKPHKPDNQVNTTLAHQLALYVVINSPIQMAADLIKNYKGHPAFQFIRDVPVIWEETKVINGEVGDFVTIARKERTLNNWFIGAITDENARNMELKFDFLPEDKKYTATIYADGENADWKLNPVSYKINKIEVTKNTVLNLSLAPGGGAAISLFEEK